MAKAKIFYSCTECGAVFPKWNGKCETCGAWNSLVQEEAETRPQALSPKSGKKLDFVPLNGADEPLPSRIFSGIKEFDRVCGGGLVPGAAILIGGDPGIGKSTLLLQVSGLLAKGTKVAYISGEEAIPQVRLRAGRLGFAKSPVLLAAATSLRDILASLEGKDAPNVVVIDSIQTLYSDSLDSAPGTVSQVRFCAGELIRLAKKEGFILFLVGHVTKEGQLAGPRVLEHMVDTVLYFEGERGHQFRILRAVKNRFGDTGEIGVFEMTAQGLAEVENPSALFLAERRGNISGSCVFAGQEGSRTVLMEIQALVSQSGGGSPRRAVVGWDQGRLSLLLAVLDARCGLALSGSDVYLNVAGGLKISEPAADLAVAAALISASSGVPVPPDMVVFGEIGLAGEVRMVGQHEARLKEAAKLGFEAALMPKRQKAKDGAGELKLVEIGHLKGLLPLFKA